MHKIPVTCVQSMVMSARVCMKTHHTAVCKMGKCHFSLFGNYDCSIHHHEFSSMCLRLFYILTLNTTGLELSIVGTCSLSAGALLGGGLEGGAGVARRGGSGGNLAGGGA